MGFRGSKGESGNQGVVGEKGNRGIQVSNINDTRQRHIFCDSLSVD
jgi:hypothetical protein